MFISGPVLQNLNKYWLSLCEWNTTWSWFHISGRVSCAVTRPYPDTHLQPNATYALQRAALLQYITHAAFMQTAPSLCIFRLQDSNPFNPDTVNCPIWSQSRSNLPGHVQPCTLNWSQNTTLISTVSALWRCCLLVEIPSQLLCAFTCTPTHSSRARSSRQWTRTRATCSKSMLTLKVSLL